MEEKMPGSDRMRGFIINDLPGALVLRNTVKVRRVIAITIAIHTRG
jgi:hypothetical protein